MKESILYAIEDCALYAVGGVFLGIIFGIIVANIAFNLYLRDRDKSK